MTLSQVTNVMLVALIIPVMASAILSPAVSKFFIGEASVEIIASSKMVDQALTMFVAFVGCWKGGMKIFLKSYYPMWVLVISIDIIIALMGMDHIEMRFYLNVIQTALGIGIVSQSLNHWSMLVIPRDQIQLFVNKQRTVLGGAGVAGSLVATLLGAIDIQTALWINVAFAFISFMINTFVLIQFKHIANKKVDVKE